MMAFPPEPAPGPSPGSPAPPAEVEQRATQIIAGYLLDASINPYQGSVPVERIQNLFRSRNPELYDQVVGSKHSAWKRYIERNAAREAVPSDRKPSQKFQSSLCVVKLTSGMPSPSPFSLDAPRRGHLQHLPH
jgi:hypothetical protein